jgi:hypothetical protein
MMQALRSRCAKPRVFAKSGTVLPMTAARFCLFALVAALAGGSAELPRAQAQQSAGQAAKPNSGQSNSGQADSGQSGAQDSQPQQNSGSSAGAPMVLGEGDDEGAPAAQTPAQQPSAQPAPAPSGQSAVQSVDEPAPPAEQQAAPAAPAVVSPESAVPALAALPPGPPDSTDPRKLVNWECADLLKMANDLKAAVDKTTKDELSLSVVRKAGEIEQMAHKLRDDMRPTMAGKE